MFKIKKSMNIFINSATKKLMIPTPFYDRSCKIKRYYYQRNRSHKAFKRSIATFYFFHFKRVYFFHFFFELNLCQVLKEMELEY